MEEAVKEAFCDVASEKESCTAEGISALSKGRRAELLDKETVKLTFPTTTHQSIIGCLFTEIAVYLRAREEHSRVISAPFAVFLKDDWKNCLEPDIAVVCDEEKLDDEGCHGAPDWVIEVVSPDSRKTDYGKKLGAYIDGGVREYWIVDWEKKVIVVYYLEHPDIPAIHHFGDIVKSGIYDDLLIDSSQLDCIRYRKAVTRNRGQDREEAFSLLLSAVQKALGDVREAVPAHLVEGVIAGELKRAKEQLEGCPPEEEALRMQCQKRYDAIAEYMPGMMTSVEEVRAYIENKYPQLLTSRNKGQIMKAVMGELKGKAESKMINEAVAELCK